MVSWIHFARVVPEFVKLNGPVIGPDKVKSPIWSVLQIIRAAQEMIACNLKICIRIKAGKWVPEPHDISILEEQNQEKEIEHDREENKKGLDD